MLIGCVSMTRFTTFCFRIIPTSLSPDLKESLPIFICSMEIRT